MGLLSAEVVRERFQKQSGDRPETAEINFASVLKIDAKATHPLAGLVFYLRPPPLRSRETFIIGRSPDYDVTVPESSVSDLHCQVEVDDDQVMITDAGSKNGTTINLESLTTGIPKPAACGDMLGVGRYSFQIFRAPRLFRELQLINLTTRRRS